LREVGDLDDVAGGDRETVRDLRDSGIAGSAEDLLDHRAAVERPAQGMLAPASADDQDFHAAALYSRRLAAQREDFEAPLAFLRLPPRSRGVFAPPSADPAASSSTSRRSCRPGRATTVSSVP